MSIFVGLLFVPRRNKESRNRSLALNQLKKKKKKKKRGFRFDYGTTSMADIAYHAFLPSSLSLVGDASLSFSHNSQLSNTFDWIITHVPCYEADVFNFYFYFCFFCKNKNKKKIKIDGINWNYLADLTKRSYLHAIQFAILGFPPQDARWNFNIHFFSHWLYD